MVFEVLRQIIARVEALFELGMRNITRHHHGAGERQARGDRVLPQFRQDLRHGTAQVNVHGLRR